MNPLKSLTFRQYMCEKVGDIRNGMSERSRRLECLVFITGENSDRIAAVPSQSCDLGCCSRGVGRLYSDPHGPCALRCS